MNNNLYSLYINLYANFKYYLKNYVVDTVNNISKIDENIYIGDLNTAVDKEYLKSIGVTHIISAISGLDAIYPNEFNYMCLDLIDNNQQYILNEFKYTNDFIDNVVRENGKVLIHCVCGISRSSTITIAYYIYKEKLSVNDALKKVKDKRNCINPNSFFIKQLCDYSDLIKNK